MCWSAHCSTLLSPRAHVYFDGEGRACQEPELNTSICCLLTTILLLSLCHYECSCHPRQQGPVCCPWSSGVPGSVCPLRQPGSCLISLRKCCVPTEDKKASVGHVKSKWHSNFCITKVCNRWCQDCSAVQEEISLTVFVCFSCCVKKKK